MSFCKRFLALIKFIEKVGKDIFKKIAVLQAQLLEFDFYFYSKSYKWQLAF